MPASSPSTILVLFGATGDLARSKLLPALRELWIDGKLPRNLQLLSVGRQKISTAEYVTQLASAKTHPFPHDLSMLQLEYLSLDFADAEGFSKLIKYIRRHPGTKVLFYMAVAPEVLHTCIDQFSQPTFREFVQEYEIGIVVEKPFGMDLTDAQDLNRKLTSIFGIRNIYRNDHYLFKNGVQEILATRNTDPQLEELLNGAKLFQIQILVAEKDDLVDRAAYFDGRGMTVDWLQSHILQMLAVVCADKDTDDFRLCKADFIDSLKLIPKSLIRAQYAGYADLPNVDPARKSETFLAVQFTSELRKWQDVSFSLIAAKAVDEKQVTITLKFRQPHAKFGLEIELTIEPEPQDAALDGHATTLVKALHQEWESFVSQPEVEAQWRVTAQVQAKLSQTPLEHYTKGTSYRHFCTENWCLQITE